MRHLILMAILSMLLSVFHITPAQQIEWGKIFPSYQQTTSTTVDMSKEDRSDKKFLPVLMFHYIEDVDPKTKDQLRYRLSFSPKKLEEFLKYFKENNIETLTFWDLKKIIDKKQEFPKKAVLLTFDDGYSSHYQNAFPLLKKYGMKGIFFIISNRPDNDANYATWKEIKEMSDEGQEIGSHTVSHFDLRTLSEKKIVYELEESKKAIEAKIAKSVISFCYPSGQYDKRAIEVAKKNYLFARTTKQGNYFSMKNRYEISTFRIFPETGLSSLEGWFKK